jgi:hypothetical protein
MGIFVVGTPQQMLFGRKDQMGGACGTLTEENRHAYKFWCGNLKAIDHLEDLGIDGRVFLKELQRVGMYSTDKF